MKISIILKKISSILKWINDNWYVATLLFSILVIFMAWQFFDVSPFQPFQEMREKQEVNRKRMRDFAFQEKLVKNYLKLGNFLLDDSRYKAAKKEFGKVLEVDKLNPEARTGILKTEIYEDIDSNFVPDAIEKKIKHIIAEYPNDAHSLVLLGKLYLQKGDLSEAEQNFQKAMDRKDHPSSAFFNMGNLFLLKKDINGAYEMFEKATKLSKFNEYYLNNLAYMYFLKSEFKNDLQKPIEIYEKILKLDYEFILPYCEIALSYRLKGNLKEATDYFKKLKKLLRDEKLINLDKNKDSWLFITGSDHNWDEIRLDDIIEKRIYALLSLSSSLFLVEDKTKAKSKAEAKEYIKEAQTIDSDQKEAVIHLVEADLQRVEKFWPKKSNPIYEFRKELSRLMP